MPPSRLRVLAESIRLAKREHAPEPESHGVGKRNQHLQCLLVPVVMEGGHTKGTSPRENVCSHAKQPLRPLCSDTAEEEGDEKSSSPGSGVRPVPAIKTKGTWGTLRSEQATGWSKTRERRGPREAQHACLCVGLSNVGRPAEQLCPDLRDAAGGTLGFPYSQPEKPRRTRTRWSPRQRLHQVSTGRTRLPLDHSLPKAGPGPGAGPRTFGSGKQALKSFVEFKDTIKNMLTINDFLHPTPSPALQAL